MPTWLPLTGWLDVVDVAVVAAFGWVAIRYFRRTRARAAFAGLAFLGVVYGVARELDLRLTAAIFQGFFAVLVLVLIVVFQEDLRRLFEQLGSWRRERRKDAPHSGTLDLLVRAVARLAATRTGALFVLPGREPLDRHVEGGVPLHGQLSEPLILSLFDSSSPGHDGAVILRGNRIERFAAHLPLSANHAALGPGGTRHAAALGLAERCDAICVVVSEERGSISVARDGALKALARAEDLVVELGATLQSAPDPRPWWRRGVVVDAGIALAAAAIAWVAFIPGSDLTEATITAPIEVTNLPKDLELESIDPPQAEIRLRGLRRDLLLAAGEGVSIRVDAYLARLGRRTFTLSADDVQHPDPLSVAEISPEKVKLSLRRSSTAADPG